MDAMNGPGAQACRIPEIDDSAMRLTLHLTWRSRTVADAALAAFSDYRCALDREERAAKHFARLMRRAGHLAETGIAFQLARIQAGDGSC